MTEIEIELNGAPHRLAEGSDLAALVEALGLGDQALALAVNRCVVPRQRWREHALRAHDKVDVVRAIGGG
jgi:sulfur carrier protein